MSWISDFFLGSRPDMVIPDQVSPYLDRILEAGNVKIGKPGRWAKQDLQAAREGRIEQMGRLAPVLHAIQAQTAGSKDYLDRMLRMNSALDLNPNSAGLNAAMVKEGSGAIDQNASIAFANAAAGAYGDAENTLENARRFRKGMALDAATRAGNLAAGSLYDRRRQGGILDDLVSRWLDPTTWLSGGILGGKSGGSLPVRRGPSISDVPPISTNPGGYR